MTLVNIKNTFHSELKNLFPINEIDTFFYLLTETYLKLKRVDVALNPDKEINKAIEKKFYSALAKLKKEIPIQYIIRETEFYGLPFYVDKNVLIPRPETEELVSWIVREVKIKKPSPSKLEPYNILDIGTGSGCIAIALAKNLPKVIVWALDVSKKAIEVAQNNAKLNQVNIQFLNKDILSLKSLPVKFDSIVSNPPYVRELEKNEIKNNVLQNEPHLALFVKDNDPLLFYGKIADFAKENLKPKGKLYFEINQYLGKETVQLLKEKGFKNIELKKDIFGKDRMIHCEL